MAKNYPDQPGLPFEVAAPLDATVQRENSGFIAPRQAALNFNLDQISLNAAGVTIPLHTPPPGKTYLITDFNFSHDGNTPIRITLQLGLGANAQTIWSHPVKGDTAPYISPGNSTELSIPSGATLYCTAPQTAGVNLYGSICGIEQGQGTG